ncbi:MAG: M23 family metallopeptidase [Anaerolineae bacterium]
MKRLFIPLLILSFTLARPASAYDRYVNLNAWPVDGDHLGITAYPDAPWTWAHLGFVPDATCPPYWQRGYDQSLGVWRDADRPADPDWQQASRGNNWVACYRNHRGTDIATPPYAPVYATAGGEVVEVMPTADDGYSVRIHHRRLLDDGLYFEWGSRYLHLAPEVTVTRGMPVVEGQVIGFVEADGGNTHLHFEVNWIEGDLPLYEDCQPDCIINPWGPVWLWIDDDFDSRIDVATDVLPTAPTDTNLITPAVSRRTGGGTSRWIVPVVPPADSGVRAAVRVDNPRSEEAVVTLRVFPASRPDEALSCVVTLPAGSMTLELAGTLPAGWRNPTLRVDAESGIRVEDPALLLTGEPLAESCTLIAQPTLGQAAVAALGAFSREAWLAR